MTIIIDNKLEIINILINYQIVMPNALGKTL